MLWIELFLLGLFFPLTAGAIWVRTLQPVELLEMGVSLG